MITSFSGKIMGRKAAEGVKIIVDELQLPITYEQYTQLVDAEYEKVSKVFF